MSERTLMQETAVETLSDEVKADIQGFATSGFGHLRHTAYLCFEITDDAAAGRKWLGGIVPRVTSAKGWRSGPEGIKRKPETTVNLAFTCHGLAALGVSDAALCSFPRAFREGMADPARVARVLGDTGDSAPDRWLFGGPANTPIHAVLILHARTEQQLEDLVADLRDPAGGATEVEGASQRGYRREDNKEHFGFRDGIGQPRIAGIKGRLAPNILPTGNFILGYPDHYKFVAQGPVAPATDDHEDILPPLTNPYYQGKNLRDLGRNGTYIVFRKLEQDVAGFWNFLQAQAKRSGDAGQERVAWLAASFVGRWPSGAPLVLSPDKDDPSLATRDDFSYAGLDPNGMRCPFGSHIRRTNPRDVIRPTGTEQSTNMSNAHRILRQGSIFGPPLFDLSILDSLGDKDSLPFAELQDDGRSSRGLHFLCVNAGIERQFELIQQQWVNNPAFNGLVANQDPLIGENRRDTPQPSRMTIEGKGGWRTEPLPRFVKTLGGAYLFMPGMRALRFLAAKER